MLILNKGQQVPAKGAVTKELFFRLFEKPLLTIPLENALFLIQSRDPRETSMKYPELDSTIVGKTLAVVQF